MRKLWSVVLLSSSILAVAATASQAQVTVGQLPAPDPPALCHSGPLDTYQALLGAGNSYVVPGTGVITSWSTEAAAGAGQTLKMKVFRPLGGASFLVVGQDGPRRLVPDVLNTFPTDLAVQSGDVIGLNDQNAPAADNACLFMTGDLGDRYDFSEGDPDAETGATTVMSPSVQGYRLNLSATLLEAPTVTAVSPQTGAIAGGTTVEITGGEFAQVQGVRFGAAAASSYIVDSEGQITAVSPAGAAGSVLVSVTTIAGTISVQQFTYQAPSTSAPSPSPSPISAPAPNCTVPKLQGKNLKASKRKLRTADCVLGKVTKKKGANAKTGKVVGQSKKPGTVLPAGTVLNVTLGKG
jgi:hypothetical protein